MYEAILIFHFFGVTLIGAVVVARSVAMVMAGKAANASEVGAIYEVFGRASPPIALAGSAVTLASGLALTALGGWGFSSGWVATLIVVAIAMTFIFGGPVRSHMERVAQKVAESDDEGEIGSALAAELKRPERRLVMWLDLPLFVAMGSLAMLKPF